MASASRQREHAAPEPAIKDGRNAVLVVNTRSRRGAQAYRHAKERLSAAGVTLQATHPIDHAERLPDVVREEIRKGGRYVIVGGGDGTISSVVGHFAYTDAVLGVLPLGTANSFARTLGIPLDLAGAVDVLARGKVADVDLGRHGGGYFANGSSIGMPAIVGRVTPPALKRWLGRAAYALVAAVKFGRYKPFRCSITIDGTEQTYQALEVRIASGAYQGGVRVAGEANPDDGRMVVHVLRGSSKWALPREWARVALRAPFRRGDIVVLKAPELVVDAVPTQHVAVDGEVVTRTPMRVSAAAKALHVMVPQSFGNDDSASSS